MINDTTDNKIDTLRQEIKDDSDAGSEISTSLEDNSSKSLQETASTSSSDSGWEDLPVGRKLRPRKRTNSSDGNENIKKKALKKVKFIEFRVCTIFYVVFFLFS